MHNCIRLGVLLSTGLPAPSQWWRQRRWRRPCSNQRGGWEHQLSLWRVVKGKSGRLKMAQQWARERLLLHLH